MAGLTPKQAVFVREYLVDLNGTKAAIRAGYAKHSAGAIAAENLIKPEIQAALELAMNERAQKTGYDAEWVLTRLGAEATANIKDLYDRETGKLLPVHDWPDIWCQGLIQGLDSEQTEYGGTVTKIRLDSRIKRVELMGRHVNVQAFKDQMDVNVNVTLSAKLAAAKSRLKEIE